MTSQRYASLLEISRQMLELAKQQEWEPLTQAQAQRATLIGALSTQQPAPTPAELASVAPAIREIQNLDRQILDLVNPWREDVAKLLTRLSPTA